MHTNLDYTYQLESERSTIVRILENRKTYNHRISDRITDNRTQQGKVTRTSDVYYSLQLYQEKFTLHSLRFKKIIARILLYRIPTLSRIAMVCGQ